MPKKIRELKVVLRHDSMLIQWSDEDEAYVVSFPEFPLAHTHGDTYDEAARHGQDVLNLLIDAYQSQGRVLPEAIGFRYSRVYAA